MLGVPILNAEPMHEAGHRRPFDQLSRDPVVRQVRFHGTDEMIQAVLPAVGPEVRQSCLLLGLLDDGIGRGHERSRHFPLLASSPNLRWMLK
jgi:hypothetical protein